jgi:hypothetical protein
VGVFAVEMLVFGLVLRRFERKASWAVVCALAANATSLFLGGMLLAFWPV